MGLYEWGTLHRLRMERNGKRSEPKGEPMNSPLDKHMQQLYKKLVDSNHSGVRILADHIDDLYRNSEAVTTEECLAELYDELGTLFGTITQMKIHLDNYQKGYTK
jgi:hypothetical protein